MEPNVLSIIEELCEKGLTISEACSYKGYDYLLIKKMIDDLGNKKSPNYDLDRYRKITYIQLKNLNKQYHHKVYGFNFQKKDVVDLISEGKINIFDSLIELSKHNDQTIIDLLLYMVSCVNNDANNKEKIISYLSQYGITFENQSSKLSNLPKSTQKEIILVALTYRVSLPNMAKIFNTNVIDVLRLYDKFRNFSRALDALIMETLDEEKNISLLAYRDTKEYISIRKTLFKELKENKDKNPKIYLDIKEEIKKNYRKINDAHIMEIKGEDFLDLTDLEKKSIALYLLKYYTPYYEAKKVFNYTNEELASCVNLYREENAVFDYKMEKYDLRYGYNKNSKSL